MEKYFDQHISRQFNQELENLRRDVMKMGGMAEEMVVDAMAALLESDTAKAESVIQADDAVNQMEKQIDEQAMEILARRQPTASDLRLVMAIVKTVNDLERVGDEAEKIARLSIELATTDRPRGNYHELENMAVHVRAMLRDALDGFARMVSEVAVTLFRADEKVDDEYEAILRQYYTYLAEDPRSTTRVINAIWIARSLERIGDHAKNIGEHIFYLVEGKDVRHISAEEKEQVILRDPEP
ncbi:MAG: phosphate transport system regulatory protein PhoU [Wenzhouxiangella sp.]|nr:MAG: phosphate transport system regulatory protein PhoU [Wenzhouxiangella sp.]